MKNTNAELAYTAKQDHDEALALLKDKIRSREPKIVTNPLLQLVVWTEEESESRK